MRQPVAIANADDGKTIIVANRRSGSLSVIDTIARSVVAEYDVGRGLADLVSISGGRYLLAVDQTANEVLLLDYQDRTIRVLERLAVSPDPVRLTLSADGLTGIVTSLWSRRLTFISLAPGQPRAPADSRSPGASNCRSVRGNWRRFLLARS